jgi:hypothetical protein
VGSQPGRSRVSWAEAGPSTAQKRPRKPTCSPACSGVTEFLDHAIADWMGALVDAHGPDADSATATRTATLVIATIRGLLLDVLATGDRDRVQDAAEAFLASLEVL